MIRCNKPGLLCIFRHVGQSLGASLVPKGHGEGGPESRLVHAGERLTGIWGLELGGYHVSVGNGQGNTIEIAHSGTCTLKLK